MEIDLDSVIKKIKGVDGKGELEIDTPDFYAFCQSKEEGDEVYLICRVKCKDTGEEGYLKVRAKGDFKKELYDK